MGLGEGARANWLFWAAIVGGASYFLAVWSGVDGVAATVWKGSGVTLLALWAAANARNLDGWLIAAALALGALGDVLLDAVGLEIGALAFLAGHVVAVVLYLRHRARPLMAALPALILVPFVSYLLPDDRSAGPGIAIYAAGLGAMAGAALISGFPRAVAIGAMLFVVSDWLIFARIGPLAGSPIPDWLVWPTYLAGQALIALGVVRRLVKEAPGDALHHRL
ncbi:lysoplasmalogenase family protein [Sphingomonas sp.]|uniref:lysoplasmalogenase family protein n=1 Tax=Sphingomonas sp. TaxID=28214 RepID=UPI002C165708|nr:lysoplasmalogenase family protein [Sphingomonas sp.]HWK36267.1 lysoplasmalogenase family protein [Sphingomonas sp.]